ncbi:MAG TPA: acetyl-CoA synthase subunit gamma [Nitrospirae bacterium]|nr:acetyl-CoA synthase subunit gamma [Nitrospirota bacterium]HDO22409.1 acetyl-CoA synthase subunit gamma [Nitrospirota bacterium]HDZ88937.1 acetyl-CoA synthase subunit gamma [Nitrospirota bacterium]
MKYSVPPGLYAVGSPDKDSGVFVSANYKLSFDKLRNSLKEMNAWILVLDTKGINVWCAAGKGTFGTEELVNRISQTQLDKVVEHRRLIVPQLGAVGVNAKNVRERTGFRVYFGPVYAKDIPEYVNSGYKKSKGMRIIRFTLWDRMALTPMEINPAMKKYYPWYALAVLLIFGAQPSGILFKDAFAGGFPFLVLGLVSVIAGAFLTPALLPFIPFRSFAVKGWIVGIVSIYLSMNYFAIVPVDGLILQLVSYLFFPLLASYIALQFTGSTTFTGMSGVNKELRIGLPVYIAGAGTSVILSIIYKLGLWGVL